MESFSASEGSTKKMLLGREKAFLHVGYDIPLEICRKMPKEPVILKRLRFGVSARSAKTHCRGHYRKWRALSDLSLGNG